MLPSGSAPHAYGSLAGQTPPPVVKLSPPTPAARSSTPKRGARCSLFTTTTKKNPMASKGQPRTAEERLSDEDESVGASVVNSGATVEDKGNENLSLKTRAFAGDKEESQKTKRVKKNK